MSSVQRDWLARIVRLGGIRVACGLLMCLLSTTAARAGSPYPATIRYPYPVGSAGPRPGPYYYTLKRQSYPGRWTWLEPQFHAAKPVYRGYYGHYFQLEFRRGY